MYPENPVRTPAPTLRPLPAFAPTVRSCIDRGTTIDVVLPGGTVPVRTCALEPVALPDGAGDFTAAPRAAPAPARDDADPFAETSARYHAGKLIDFLSDLDGTPALGALQIVTGVRIAAGLLEGDLARAADPARDLVAFPQAFFLRPGEGAPYRAIYGVTGAALWLGQGTKVDYAYDGDVVAHETVHAVVATTLALGTYRLGGAGLSVEPAALNEALADYFAAALTDDPVVGEHAATESAVAEARLRSLENDTTCTAVDGEPHDDSAVIAGALWKTRLVDRPGVDRAVYAAMKTGAAPDLGFEGFAARLAPLLPQAARVTFAAELTARAVPCAPVLPLAPGAPVRGERRPFAAPGTLATGTVLAPGIVQLRVELPATATRLRISFTGGALVASPLVAAPATPFRPVVLAGWDHPLRWSGGASDADVRVSVDGVASFGVELDPPPGTRSVWLQIANEGEGEGRYDALAVELLPVVADVPDAAAPPVVPDASVPAPGTGAAAVDVVGGSGCNAGGAPPVSWLGLALLALARSRNTKARDRRGDPPPSRD